MTLDNVIVTPAAVEGAGNYLTDIKWKFNPDYRYATKTSHIEWNFYYHLMNNFFLLLETYTSDYKAIFCVNFFQDLLHLMRLCSLFVFINNIIQSRLGVAVYWHLHQVNSHFPPAFHPVRVSRYRRLFLHFPRLFLLCALAGDFRIVSLVFCNFL